MPRDKLGVDNKMVRDSLLSSPSRLDVHWFGKEVDGKSCDVGEKRDCALMRSLRGWDYGPASDAWQGVCRLVEGERR